MTDAHSAVERLAWGGDVSLGHYLEGTAFHSLALATCSPNHTTPDLPCPARQG
ncbi:MULTISPECIES: hypothetical protein [unclassified Streptomyces]|uniref:hypothetical protein n=1 Tax=unclassified Streptomyces TaxID=2593676 RepID=UPI001661647E|nr:MULTISPECIES: hypothetical protein [unclassified Streptomyces]